MPYDEEMARRIRAQLEGVRGLVEKKMFGGIGWTINGHMATGAHNDGRLMIRCPKENYDDIMKLQGAVAMERNGKGMRGWVLVDPKTVASDDGLAEWVGRGREYAESLPPK